MQNGNGIETKVLRVRSIGGDISVQVVSISKSACGGYTSPTISSLGYKHRVISWWPNSNGLNRGEITISSSEDNNLVTVTIMKGRGVRFTVRTLL